MRNSAVLLMVLVLPGVVTAAEDKPAEITEVRDLGNREFAIEILASMELPSGDEVTRLDRKALDARAAAYVCGSNSWTSLSDDKSVRTVPGQLAFGWTLKIKCDVAAAPAPPEAKPDEVQG